MKLKLLFFLLIVFLLLSVSKASVYPTLIYIDKPFASHVTDNIYVTNEFLAQYDKPLGYLNWNKDSGLEVPEGESKAVGEVILLGYGRPVTVLTFMEHHYREAHKFKTLCYVWVRHSTQWRPANYNPNPQPHGDEKVQLWDCDRLSTARTALEKDMRNDNH